MTKPTYSELETELLRVRGLLQRQWIPISERVPDMVLGWVMVLPSHDGLNEEDCDGDTKFGCALGEPANTLWTSDPDNHRYFTHWMPMPALPNFPEHPELVSQGAESADIGKLDTADKSCTCTNEMGLRYRNAYHEKICLGSKAGSAETGGEK